MIQSSVENNIEGHLNSFILLFQVIYHFQKEAFDEMVMGSFVYLDLNSFSFNTFVDRRFQNNL